MEFCTEGWNWTLCHLEKPLQKQIAICRFCQFSAQSSPQIWRNDHNDPGGQDLTHSLPTRIIVVKATSFILVFTRRLIYQRLKDYW
jgi:hypothetical protein